MKIIEKLFWSVLLLWFMLFVTDMVLVYFFGVHPIFALPISGGEYMGYRGLGYVVEYFYPLTDAVDTVAERTINVYPYLVSNVLLIVSYFVIKQVIRNHKNFPGGSHVL